jgi:hypothetical protein
MGDFRLPVSRDRLQADLARFAGLYEEVVKPALATLRSNALQRLSDSLPAGKERVSLALFGLPRWPYLAILQERMAIEALVAAEGETTGSIGALQVSTEQYKETFRPDVRLVVLSTVHAASAARSFVALLPAGHPQPLCMLDLPVQLPDTVSSHA